MWRDKTNHGVGSVPVPQPVTQPIQGCAHAPTARIDVGGRTLAYRRVGVGQPLLLCQRFRGTMDDWDPAFIDALVAQGLEVIVFDYSGLGLSTGTPTYLPPSLAQDAAALVQALGLPQVAVGGWSVGGMAVQVLLAQAPAWLTHAVLLATTPPGAGMRAGEEVFHQTALKPHNDLDDEVVLFFDPHSPASRAAAAQSHQRIAHSKALRGAEACPPVPMAVVQATLPPTPRVPPFPAEALRKALAHSRTPILHLGGDRDICFPVDNWYALQASWPTLQLVTLPQAGHGPHHQYPQLAANYVTAFVQHTPAAGARDAYAQ